MTELTAEETIELIKKALKHPPFFDKWSYWVVKRGRIPSQTWLTANIRAALRELDKEVQ